MIGLGLFFRVMISVRNRTIYLTIYLKLNEP